MAQAQRGGLGKGPREGGLADFFTRGAQAFPPGCLAALHQACVRGAVVHAGQAADVMACLQQHEAEHLANAGHGLSQGAGLGIVVRGGCEEREFQILAERVVRGDEGQIDRHGLVHGCIVTALGHPWAIRWGSALFLPISGTWYWRWVLCTWAKSAARLRLRGAAPEQGTGGAPLREERQRPAGASRHAARRPSCARRSCRFWRSRRGGLSWRGRAPERRVCRLDHRDQRARTR